MKITSQGTGNKGSNCFRQAVPEGHQLSLTSRDLTERARGLFAASLSLRPRAAGGLAVDGALTLAR